MVAQGVKVAAAMAMPRRQAQPTQQEHSELCTGDDELLVRGQDVVGQPAIAAALGTHGNDVSRFWNLESRTLVEQVSSIARIYTREHEGV